MAGVAHEINSPVGTSLTIASALERKRVAFAAESARGELKRSSLIEFLEFVAKLPRSWSPILTVPPT